MEIDIIMIAKQIYEDPGPCRNSPGSLRQSAAAGEFEPGYGQFFLQLESLYQLLVCPMSNMPADVTEGRLSRH